MPPPFSVSVPRLCVPEQSLLLDCENPRRQCADPKHRSASDLKALLDLANGSYVFLFYTFLGQHHGHREDVFPSGFD